MMGIYSTKSIEQIIGLRASVIRTRARHEIAVCCDGCIISTWPRWKNQQNKPCETNQHGHK